MKRRERVIGEGPKGELRQAAEDAVVSERWPRLYAHLVDLVYDDGTRRTTSSVVMFAEDGWFKLCINDRDAGLVAFVAERGLYAALDALERGLEEDGLDWRKSGGKRGK